MGTRFSSEVIKHILELTVAGGYTTSECAECH